MAVAAEPTVRSSRTGALALQVAAKETVADDVVAVTLQAPDGGRLPDWTAGAHVDLVLPNGLVRQYSLCGDRWDPSSYRIGVLREVNGSGGSAYVHDHLAVGDLVGVGGPRNHFPMVPSTHYRFVAGGIGITPLLPMIRQAEMLGADWSLLYGGRTRGSIAFSGELARYGPRVEIAPQDVCGLLDLERYLADIGDESRVYCCGPPPLLAAAERICARMPPQVLRVERFTAKPLAAPVRSAPFTVVLARSGREVLVGTDRSVLDALRAAGTDVLSSCREGTCGTCETPVLEGIPEHRDSILTDADRESNDAMFVCVSRACSERLVLDL